MPVAQSVLDTAVANLRTGGIIAYPTEAVFGLGCDPDNHQALQRLLALKQRQAEKGLILIAASLSQLQPYLADLAIEQQQLAMTTWPGPVTWLWPARDSIAPLLHGMHNTLAVRVTAHPIASAICIAFGKPLVSTSANLAGESPVRDAAGVRRVFADKIDYIVEGSVGERDRPTEIRDALTGAIIRPG